MKATWTTISRSLKWPSYSNATGTGPGVILIAQHQFVGVLTRHGYEVAHLRVKVDKWLPAQFGLQANSSGGAHLYHYRRVGRAEHRPLLPRRLAAGGGYIVSRRAVRQVIQPGNCEYFSGNAGEPYSH